MLGLMAGVACLVAEWPMLPYVLFALPTVVIVGVIRKKPSGLRAFLSCNGGFVFAGAVALLVGSAFGREVAAERAAKVQARAVREEAERLEQKRKADAEEARREQLRRGAPAAAANLMRAVADLRAASTAKRWTEVCEIYDAIGGDMAPYLQLDRLPEVMIAAVTEGGAARAGAEPICRARARLTEARRQIEMGRAAQAGGDFVAARTAFEMAHTELNSIGNEQARYTPERSRLVAEAVAKERSVRASAAQQQRRRDREALRRSHENRLSDLERILQARCGRTTNENGEWRAEGAMERAFCRRDVELELERRR